MASGVGKNVGYEEKEGCRFVYDPLTPCKLIQIRLFRQYAKLGDPVNAYNLIYDDYFNVIGEEYVNGPDNVNNDDIRVPTKPTILTLTNSNATGSYTGKYVKDGDKIIVTDRTKSNKEIGSGIIISNSFNVIIDTSNYLSGELIEIGFEIRNDRFSFHGAGSLEVIRYIKS